MIIIMIGGVEMLTNPSKTAKLTYIITKKRANCNRIRDKLSTKSLKFLGIFRWMEV